MTLEGIGSCFTGLMPGSLISIKSSSSSFVAGVTPPSLAPFASFGVAQAPSGSMMTCSTSGEVDRRMSSTYLYPYKSNEQRPLGRGGCHPWFGLTGQLAVIRNWSTWSILGRSTLAPAFATGETTMHQSIGYECKPLSDKELRFVESIADI